MRRSQLLLLSVAGLAILACFVLFSSPPDREANPDKGVIVGSLHIGEPVQVGNLTIFPVTSRKPKNRDRFTTLDEGLKNGTVEISEVGAGGQSTVNQPPVPPNSGAANAGTQRGAPPNPGGQGPFSPNYDPNPGNDNLLGLGGGGADVNKLMVSNTSDKPLYLMPGEIIVGGQQDRAIAKEVVIPPGKKGVPIDVYCVEQGRWSQRESNDSIAGEYGTLANDLSIGRTNLRSLLKASNEGKFVLTTGALNGKARYVAHSGFSQGKVWHEVGKANSSLGNGGSSDSFTHNYVASKTRDKLQPILDKLQKPIAKQRRIVGVIVAVNGKVQAVDVFESTPLFRKLWPKLLKSYALDAIAAANDKNGADQKCPLVDAEEFLKSCRTAKVAESTTSQGGLTMTKRAGKKGVSFTFGNDGVGSGMGGGGFGGGVHFSGFAK